MDVIVRVQGIPDRIGVMPGSGGSPVAFVNHEESRVPFQGQADLQDASVSRLTLNTTPGDHEGAVFDASVAIPASAGFIRFCSSTMVGPAEGFARPCADGSRTSARGRSV